MKCVACNTEIPVGSLACPKCSSPETASDVTLPLSESEGDVPSSGSKPETVFSKKYQIVEKLGGGGMGEVFRARDITLNRSVALKFMKPEFTRNRKAIELFVREAQAASTLDHQNLCTIHEIDRTSDGQLYIAMAYYPGVTLWEKMRSGQIAVREALDIVIQIAQGLSVAHRNGIIHRDVKPANIIISDEGIIKIVDFGVAMLSDAGGTHRSEEIVGTPVYMSPEQTLGRPTSYPADVWSTGVLFYEMLTGKRPHTETDQISLDDAIVNENPTSPRDLNSRIPGELERIVMTCLAKSPSARFESAETLAGSLIGFRQNLEQRSFTSSDEEAFEGKETERRLATFLRVELHGYSKLMDELNAEDAASHLTEFTNLAWNIIRKYGGQTSRITGTKFSAYFGVPIALEDAPIMAVNAAIELRNGLEDLNIRRNLAVQLGMSAGIDTGMVIAGIVATGGSKGYSVTGPAVTNASELVRGVADGRIVVGEMAYRQTRNAFRYKAVRPTSVSRKGDATQAFELLSTHEELHRTTVEQERIVESSMVGRHQDLIQLRGHVRDVTEGKGSVVFAVGEAGIGKSRLVAELLMSEEVEEVTVVEGRALSIGQNLSFHPIIDLIKNWAGVGESESPESSVQKVRAFVENHAAGQTDDIFPFIATFMGLKITGAASERVAGIEGEALEKLVLKSLKDLITLASQQRPVVMVFEDFHWADTTSVEILESLFRLVESNPILIIVVCRPDFRDTTERLLVTLRENPKKIGSEIIVESLDEQETERLLRNLLHSETIPRSLEGAIVPKSGGNPFFVEEIVRSLIDENVLAAKNGRFVPTKAIDSTEIPETINEVVMNRIDRLDSGTRSLLKIASAIGRNFFYRILVEVAAAVPSIKEKISHLEEVQIIRESRRMDELEYLFKHAIVQQVAYESMLLQQRRELHLAIAQAIEHVFADRLHEFFGMLAFHYGRAEELEKAEEYMIKAGEEALKSSASNEALHYYTQALDIYLKKAGERPERRKVAMLEKNIALALFNKGRFEEADVYFERVLTFYGQKFPKTPLGMATKSLLGLASFLLRLNFRVLQQRKHPSPEVSDFVNLFFKKDTGLVVADPKRMVVECFYWLKLLLKYDIEEIENGTGILSLSSGTFSYSGISFAVSRKIQEYARDKVDQGNPKDVMYDRVADILIRTFGGDWARFPKYDKRLIERCVKVGEVFYTASFLFTLALPYVERGEKDVVKDIIKKGRFIAEELENDFAHVIMQQLEIILLIKYKDIPQALQAAEDGIDLAMKTGYQASYYYFLAYKMNVEVMLRDFEGAEKSFERLTQIQSELRVTPYHNSPFLLARFLLSLAQMEEGRSGVGSREWENLKGQTLRFGRQAVRNTRSVAYDRVEAYRLMGRYWWLVDRQKRALTWWSRSLREAERLDVPLELSRTSFEVGRRLGGSGSRHRMLDGLSSEHYLETADGLFRKHGLERDLETVGTEFRRSSAESSAEGGFNNGSKKKDDPR
jgi:serine/threonine protein kinase/tetratricopeptide (TPR) repeat protein